MLDINKVVVGETKVRIIEIPNGVEQKVGDVGIIVINDNSPYLPLSVKFSNNQCGDSEYKDSWWFNPKHLEIVEDDANEENGVEYNIGDKFRVVNLDGDLNLSKCGVKVGDVGEIIQVSEYNNTVLLYNENWIGEEGYASKEVCFYKSNIEPFVEITKSRWEEIIESMDFGYDLTDKEVTLVKSVLKSNAPSNVVEDKKDPVISKEVQTHLYANYIGSGSSTLYYKSEILKKWFYWCDLDYWEDCSFSYEDDSNLIPIAIAVNK